MWCTYMLSSCLLHQFPFVQAKTMQWEDDENYSSWIPPSSQFIIGLHKSAISLLILIYACPLDQSGDGRTHLNEKFGY